MLKGVACPVLFCSLQFQSAVVALPCADDVKRSYIGYYFGGGGVSPLKKASTINEILHLMHSRIINNEGLLQSIPLLNEKDNQHNNTISLRGIRNPMFEQLLI